MEIKQECKRTDTLFFVIYKEQSEELHHLIVYRESKKVLIDELRCQGLHPIAIFSHSEVEQVKNNEFESEYIGKTEIQYLKDNLSERDMAN